MSRVLPLIIRIRKKNTQELNLFPELNLSSEKEQKQEISLDVPLVENISEEWNSDVSLNVPLVENISEEWDSEISLCKDLIRISPFEDVGNYTNLYNKQNLDLIVENENKTTSFTEKELNSIPDDPPQNMPILWYRRNGWEEFLNDKVIIIKSGNRLGKQGFIKKWNKINIRVEFSNGKVYSQHNNNIIEWRYPE